MVQDNEPNAQQRAGRPTAEKAKAEQQRRLGLLILEVVRATVDGLLPINQRDIHRLLKKNHRLDLAPSQSSKLVSILREEFNGKIWLRTDGHHPLYLFSEETTLVEARAIKALFLAKELIDGDEQISIEEWITLCEKKLNCSSTDCEAYLADFVICGYVVGDLNKVSKTVKLDVRAIGEDDFYLQPAAKAGLKKRVPRTKRPK